MINVTVVQSKQLESVWSSVAQERVEVSVSVSNLVDPDSFDVREFEFGGLEFFEKCFLFEVGQIE